MTQSTAITIHPIAGAVGAEIEGVDLAAPMDAATVRRIRQALLDHLVIFFRDQTLSDAQFLAFSRLFGRPVEYPFVKGSRDFPEIIDVVKQPHEQTNFGGIWHSDTTYLQTPPMASILYAIEVPPFGGDTLFSNQYLAYERLSDGMRALLDPLIGVNASAKADVSKTREDLIRGAVAPAPGTDFVAEHPVVREHPETGRKALFVNIAHTTHFAGFSEEESAPILNYLFQHQVRPEFTCRFAWKKGSLAFWDNRAVQHNPINDYHGYRRAMRRITLAGDDPARPSI